jgi:hypothetical protein
MEPWIVIYLRLLRGDRNLFDNEYLSFLLQNIQPPTDIPNTFVVMWYRHLGLRLLDQDSPEKAYVAFSKAAYNEFIPNNQKLLQEHSRLARFYQNMQRR